MGNDEKIELMANEVHDLRGIKEREKGVAKFIVGVGSALAVGGIMALFSINANVIKLLERDNFKQEQLDNVKREIQEVKTEIRLIKENQNK